MVKRLGAVPWRRLHRLAYAIAVLDVVHYLWLAKVGVTGRYYHAAVLALLLGIRGWAALRQRARGGGLPTRSPLSDPLS